jgi:hypothetical protein
MFCESYRAALSEAALRGERLLGDAEAHLAGCTSCREAFSQEQAMLGLLNSELRSLANADAPASLVAKVRSQIAELPESRTWRWPWLEYVAAVLVLGAIILSFGARSRLPSAQRVTAVREVASISPAGPKSAPKQAEPQREFVPTQEQKRLGLPAIKETQPEVLFAAEERLGLQRYAVSLKLAAAGRTTVVKADAATEIAPLEIAGIEVRRLSIEPLESGDAN